MKDQGKAKKSEAGSKKKPSTVKGDRPRQIVEKSSPVISPPGPNGNKHKRK